MSEFWTKYKKWIITAICLVACTGIFIGGCNCGWQGAKGCYKQEESK